MKKKYYLNGWHSVSPSPWPLLMSISVFSTAVGFVIWVSKSFPYLVMMGLMSMLLMFFFWCKDVVMEATYQGAHTLSVMYTLKMGFYFFVISEAMFFTSFFWAYFHVMLSPSPEIGVSWPPKGMEAMSPLGMPLLNTIILVWSGMFASASHHFCKGKNKELAMMTLNMSFLLGMLFTMIQYYEFSWCTFTMADSVFGSTFFILTGFHGFHVLIGTMFLIVNYYSLKLNHFTPNSHLGLECAMMYWHFVDMMWILVYMVVYIWSYYKF